MNKDRLYGVLVVSALMFSLIMIIYSVLSVSLVQVGPLYKYESTTFNLAFHMPLSLWIAISVMSGVILLFHFRNCKFMSRKSTYILALGMSMTLILVFQGLPYVVETNPRFVDSWVHGGTAKGILEAGVLQPEQFSYQAFPSSFVLLSTLSLVSGIPLTVLLRFIPILFIVLFFFFLALLVYRLSGGPKLASVFVLIYGLSTFGLAFHFSPENLGWLFFILLLAYMLRNIKESRERVFDSRRDLVVILVLLAGIATTHAVTQFMTVLTIILLLVFARKIWTTELASHDLFTVLALSITVFAAWTSIFGVSYFSSYISGFSAAFRTVLSDFMSSLAARPLQAQFPSEVTVLLDYRDVLYGTVLVCSFIGDYLLWKNNRRRFNYILALLIASIVGAPLTLFGILPLERTIKLAFIPLSILAAYLVTEKKRLGGLLLIFLLATFPVNFASLYWNEMGRSMYYDWEVDSAKFVASNFHGVLLAEFRDTGVQEFYGNFSKVYNDYYLLGKRPDLFEMYNYSFIEENGIGLVYITQLTTESAGEKSGQTLTLSNFLDNPFLDCAYSNEYSAVLVRAQS